MFGREARKREEEKLFGEFGEELLLIRSTSEESESEVDMWNR